MIKRMTKATSLLVAAAAIISIVPAHAADYTKIESQEGTVYNAVAYKDGKFYIDGEVNDKDEAAYYVADGEYKDLSDVDSGSDIETYGDKYLDVQDGDYFVDLDNGSVTDESIKENAEDDAASALRKNLKKDNDGRYTSTDAETTQDLTDKELKGNKFSDPWYGFLYSSDDTKTNGGSDTLNVYTDANGNYIDADYNLGSIKVTTTKDGATPKTVSVSNTDDTYDAVGNDDAVTGSVAKDSTVIGQDTNYIYRKATVTVTLNKTASDAGVGIDKINGISVATDANTFKAETKEGVKTVSFDVIQKISKAQASGDVDGAKYAKSATTYIISDEDGKNETFTYDNYTVANGKLIGYTADGKGNLLTRTATLSSKSSYYYVDLGDEASEDVQLNGSTSAVDTDVDGNVWRLDAGYIYKWDNDEDWTKVYKVDGSFDKLSVYNENNMVSWSEDDEVYSVIADETTTEPTDPTDPVVTAGWVKAADGTWSYNKADGTKATGWLQDGGTWYYLKADGTMATGWVQDGSTWYYLQSSGAMSTGWVNDNGTWYYLNGSGAMATGWLNDNGTWYFLNSSGAMLANTTVDGYKLGASGAWVK